MSNGYYVLPYQAKRIIFLDNTSIFLSGCLKICRNAWATSCPPYGV
ncbi:MAG: hypothetical protein J6U05_03710 [Neisseriaceae bacterium]|nr:hypothetical protein [Neisseriaceae bacterium]